jgi:hypothetical protein
MMAASWRVAVAMGVKVVVSFTSRVEDTVLCSFRFTGVKGLSGMNVLTVFRILTIECTSLVSLDGGTQFLLGQDDAVCDQVVYFT